MKGKRVIYGDPKRRVFIFPVKNGPSSLKQHINGTFEEPKYHILNMRDACDLIGTGSHNISLVAFMFYMF